MVEKASGKFLSLASLFLADDLPFLRYIDVRNLAWIESFRQKELSPWEELFSFATYDFLSVNKFLA
jgi:hypothetical protein